MNVDTFFLQPFKTHRKRLVPSQRVASKTKHHALRDGERLGRTAEGLAVVLYRKGVVLGTVDCS